MHMTLSRSSKSCLVWPRPLPRKWTWLRPETRKFVSSKLYVPSIIKIRKSLSKSMYPKYYKYWQIMLGLTKTSAEKMDLALARDTKICKFKVIYSKYYKHWKVVSKQIHKFSAAYHMWHPEICQIAPIQVRPWILQSLKTRGTVIWSFYCIDTHMSMPEYMVGVHSTWHI